MNQRFYKILGIGFMIFFGMITAAIIYLEAQSPIHRFVNDTDSEVNALLVGGTSPGVRLSIPPGEKQIVNMPYWWGEPDLPRDENGKRIKPSLNLVVYKVYKFSSFPEDWRN